jgi:hypothetical protein
VGEPIAQATCSVCGGPIRHGNSFGICSSTRECLNARAEVKRRAKGALPKGSRGRSICSIDGCSKIVHAYGLCQGHDQRKRLQGDPGPAEMRQWRRTAIAAGDTFGWWTALSASDDSRDLVPCRCQCGKERTVKAAMLVNDKSLSCGCRRNHPQPRAEPYMAAGTVYGRLTALEDAWRAADRIRFRCECGAESTRTAVSVGSGDVRSCLCVKREITHGLSKHPLYPIWKGMLNRTGNPAAHNYPLYGGRGITVCDRWQGPCGLVNFIADVGERPSRKHSLDRTNNDGNYEPGNVRWATPPEQARNKRTVSALTAERDALAAELEAVTALLALAQEATGRLF